MTNQNQQTLKKNSEKCSDDLKIAYKFNIIKHFISVFTTDAEPIPAAGTKTSCILVDNEII
jgi:hypothetical protein